MRILTLSFAALAAIACSASRRSVASPPFGIASSDARETRFVDSLLATLTLEEKLGQLTMSPAEGLQTGPTRPAGNAAQIRSGQVGSVIGIWGADRTRALQRIAVEESPHHIPILFSLDVIHGFRTVFPVPLAEAASFDPGLAQSDARIAATEAAAHGITWTFAPMVDIARDPRWGRIVEGSGEEPYLGSVMAAARVRGFQDAHLSDSASLLATAKHFAGYGASEGGRDYATAELSERTFWNTYLPPFRAAIDAGVGSVMPAFSAVNGSPPHASVWMLRDVLRRRLGFKGLIVSDWTAIMELVKHSVATTSGDAAQLAMHAGVDVDMSDGLYADSLPARARDNPQLRSEIDAAARRVLRVKYELGLFSDPYHGASEAKASRVTLTVANRAAARAGARESIVLLKNERATLPLSRDIKSLAVIGALAADAKSAMGSWTIVGEASEAVSVLEGLKRANPSMRVRYAAGAEPEGADTSGIPEAEALAREADAIVLVLGESSDRTGEAESRAFLELPFAQLQLAQRVSHAARGKPLVVVLMNGRPLAIPWIADSIPAIVESWYLGSEHGNALADVLFGAYSPSGKLPVTVPRATGQVPIYLAHTNTGRPHDPSDKYTSGYNDFSDMPLYPYGFGLSYTTFRYGDVHLSRDHIRAGDSLGVSVSVSNVGTRDADEVVQLYLRDDVASVARPVKQLVRFQRVHLRAGTTQAVSFTLGARDLSFYDLQMRRVVEPGSFTLFAGTSSADTREAHFIVTGDTLVLEPSTPRMQ
ncbi:MAG TPA: glycoside hydrolase family 3 N-terminal domain-containing protein [Gemmatimonadaceae bacterium]